MKEVWQDTIPQLYMDIKILSSTQEKQLPEVKESY